MTMKNKQNDFKILAVNPGSTSTKVALFEGEKKVFSENVSHDASKLAEFPNVSSQLEYRIETINEIISKSNVDLEGLDACVGRGGGLPAIAGGTYEVNDLLLQHATIGINGTTHPAQLGVQIARAYAEKYGCKAYTVNPPDVDEFQPVARVTGIKGIKRQSHLHALNLKETAIRHAKSMGKKYEDVNFIVCHIGGGVSVSAHRKGLMIDGNDIIRGEGPMAPTRCGSIPVSDMIDICFSGKTKAEVKQLCQKEGGFVSYFGTSDAKEVSNMAKNGNQEARLVFDAMIYQICKTIGEMAAVLKGEVDGILLGGGIVYSEYVVEKITENCSFIAPVTAYPGEFEMEALCQGVVRVLNGEETVKEYK